MGVGKGRGPLRHGSESEMDEGQCWEVKGGLLERHLEGEEIGIVTY